MKFKKLICILCWPLIAFYLTGCNKSIIGVTGAMAGGGAAVFAQDNSEAEKSALLGSGATILTGLGSYWIADNIEKAREQGKWIGRVQAERDTRLQYVVGVYTVDSQAYGIPQWLRSYDSVYAIYEPQQVNHTNAQLYRASDGSIKYFRPSRAYHGHEFNDE